MRIFMERSKLMVVNSHTLNEFFQERNHYKSWKQFDVKYYFYALLLMHSILYTVGELLKWNKHAYILNVA